MPGERESMWSSSRSWSFQRFVADVLVPVKRWETSPRVLLIERGW